MNDVERYVIEEFLEEYQLGHYGFDELKRRLIKCGAEHLLEGLPVMNGRARPAMLAGADNPWQDGGQETGGQMTSYKSGDTDIEAYMAWPNFEGPKPGIVNCHENKGL